MTRVCRECGEQFKGRSDKIFCTAYCRTAHYNRLNSDTTNYIRNVNNILRKNRRILASLNPQGKANIHRSELLRQGFNFNYITNTYTTRAGKEYRFCYEQGYLGTGNDYYTLVIKEEYVR